MENYIKTHLHNEFLKILKSDRKRELPEINIYEKTLIYKYSADGYMELNQNLMESDGNNNSIFGILLEQALNKLPSYKSLVYRGAFLLTFDLNKYKMALQSNSIITEHSFLSATKSRMIANNFGTTLFIIISKNGKEIEKISKFGIHGKTNEQEVLFKPNSIFKVLSVINDIITLEEI